MMSILILLHFRLTTTAFTLPRIGPQVHCWGRATVQRGLSPVFVSEGTPSRLIVQSCNVIHPQDIKKGLRSLLLRRFLLQIAPRAPPHPTKVDSLVDCFRPCNGESQMCRRRPLCVSGMSSVTLSLMVLGEFCMYWDVAVTLAISWTYLRQSATGLAQPRQSNIRDWPPSQPMQSKSLL